jgi:hypothetical protein
MPATYNKTSNGHHLMPVTYVGLKNKKKEIKIHFHSFIHIHTYKCLYTTMSLLIPQKTKNDMAVKWLKDRRIDKWL